MWKRMNLCCVELRRPANGMQHMDINILSTYVQQPTGSTGHRERFIGVAHSSPMAGIAVELGTCMAAGLR